MVTKYACRNCQEVYDPFEGDPSRGIPPDTEFEDLPEDGVCPKCKTPKSEFMHLTL